MPPLSAEGACHAPSVLTKLDRKNGNGSTCICTTLYLLHLWGVTLPDRRPLVSLADLRPPRKGREGKRRNSKGKERKGWKGIDFRLR